MDLFNNDETTVNKLKENIFKHWDEMDRGVLSEDELLALFTKNIPELKNEVKLFWENLEKLLTK